MDNIWKNLKEQIEYPESGILSKEVFKDDKFDVSLFCMAQGTEISEHTSTRHGFVYVVEGKGNFKLEGQDIVMSDDVIIYMDNNAKHSLKSESNLTFALILFKD